jgi:hypothetical protein
MNKIKEIVIERRLAKFFRSSKGKYYVTHQVRFSQKRIDIVLIEKQTKEIWAIEVKIHDWKDALRQANLNKLACHKSYVAIWHEYSHRALDQRRIFEDHGVGLMVISDKFEPVIEIQSPMSDCTNYLACCSILNSTV